MTIVQSQILKCVFTKGVEFIINEDGKLISFHDGKSYQFHDLPDFAYEAIRRKMGNENATIEEMEPFVSRYWGGCDNVADIDENGNPGDQEFVHGYSENFSSNGTALSKAQIRVLTKIHKSDEDIADENFISKNTVARQTQDIYRIIGISKRPQAVVWAITKGII